MQQRKKKLAYKVPRRARPRGLRLPQLVGITTIIVAILSLIFIVQGFKFSTQDLQNSLSFASSTETFTPIEDSTVKEHYEKKNYGEVDKLISSSYSSKRTQVAYLKFDLRSLEGKTIKSASLKITPSLSRKIDKVVKVVPDSSWQETTISWVTRPSLGSNLGVIPLQEVKNGVAIDVTLDAATLQQFAGKTVTIGIDNAAESNTLEFYSSESNYKPTLTIATETEISASPKPSPTPVSEKPTVPSLPTSIPSPTAVPNTPPVSVTSKGVWISPTEIASLPMSGETWTQMKKIADGDIGSANMSDQDSTHPERTLALALVAARTGSASYRDKAVAELLEVIGTENNPDPSCEYTRSTSQGGPAGARSMAVGRNLTSYVVAADVINLRKGGYDPNGKGTQFQSWIEFIRVRQNCPNNYSGTWPDGKWATIGESHDEASSNGNTMAGAARVAAAAYLNDTAELDRAWLTFRRYAGDRSVGPNASFNSFSKTWVHNTSSPVGINPRGATCNDSFFPADGALPNDQGRGGSCPSSSRTAPGYTQYPWEGLQGAYGQAVVFHRLGYKDPSGKDPWQVSDSALLRAVQYQWWLQSNFGGSWYDSDRAAWVKHLANYVYGYKPVSYKPYGGGRNMDWTQWMYQ